jgi:anti-sigma factor RsiW
MRCRKAQRSISLRVDGRLAPSTAEQLQEHLASCPECRGVAARLEHAWQALGILGRPPKAPDDWASIRDAVASRPGDPRWPWADLRAALRPALAAGAVLAMAAAGAAGGVLARRWSSPAPPPTFEASLVAETLGVLPWSSPVSALAHGLDEEVLP